MPSYIASGGITITGCADLNHFSVIYDFNITIGETYYVLAKAQKGVIEKVVIKKANLVSSEGLESVFNYIDTTNRVWFEEDLTTRDVALILAEAYLSLTYGLNLCVDKVAEQYHQYIAMKNNTITIHYWKSPNAELEDIKSKFLRLSYS